MQICLQEDLTEEIKKYLYLPKIVLTDRCVIELLTECDEFDGVIPIINLINKQGISHIGPISKIGMVYTRKGVQLPFTNLSHTELVFLVTYAALKLDRGLIVQHDIKQFDKETFKVYYNSFSRSDLGNKITIIADTFTNRDWLLSLVEV